MKIAFLVFHGFADHNGITKKIHYQVEALRQCGNDVSLCYIDMDVQRNHRLMVDDSEYHFFGNSIKAKIQRRIDFRPLYRYISENEIDFVYIRYNHNASPFFIQLLKKLKQIGVKIMLEIPTYPYDKEYETLPLMYKLGHWIDCFFRTKMARYVTRIVTFSNEKTIWNCPTVCISNGIDFSAIKLKRPHESQTVIQLTGVADFSIWHGYDRAIAGIDAYYTQGGTENVMLNLVGEGVPEVVEQLHRMVQQSSNLKKHVLFHGALYGDALDEILDRTDMGIASLARHRSGITYIKTLKNREFAARGIPFIYSEIDEDFENQPYVMKAPADESPLDIQAILDFLKNCKLSSSDIRTSIEEKLSWTMQMKKVCDEAKNKL